MEEERLNPLTDDVAGVEVRHGLEKAMEGGAVSPTLKDQNIAAEAADWGINERTLKRLKERGTIIELGGRNMNNNERKLIGDVDNEANSNDRFKNIQMKLTMIHKEPSRVICRRRCS